MDEVWGCGMWGLIVVYVNGNVRGKMSGGGWLWRRRKVAFSATSPVFSFYLRPCKVSRTLFVYKSLAQCRTYVKSEAGISFVIVVFIFFFYIWQAVGQVSFVSLLTLIRRVGCELFVGRNKEI